MNSVRARATRYFLWSRAAVSGSRGWLRSHLSRVTARAEIAAELVVSINTVRTQVRSIYHKLNVKNRHEAVAIARHWRLL
jgi:hypothetical protein